MPTLLLLMGSGCKPQIKFGAGSEPAGECESTILGNVIGGFGAKDGALIHPTPLQLFGSSILSKCIFVVCDVRHNLKKIFFHPKG